MLDGPEILLGVLLVLLVLLALCEVRLPVSWRTPLSVEQLVLGSWLGVFFTNYRVFLLTGAPLKITSFFESPK